jgi:hypothetical protein
MRRRPAVNVAERTNTSPLLRLVPPVAVEAEARDPEVVAEILADGTIRAKDPDARSWVTEDKPDWSTGHVANGRWILWWQRRQIA